MAKTAKHDVFDMSDDIARIKRTKSVEVSDVGDSGNDLSYTTGKGSQRRVAKDTDKMVKDMLEGNEVLILLEVGAVEGELDLHSTCSCVGSELLLGSHRIARSILEHSTGSLVHQLALEHVLLARGETVVCHGIGNNHFGVLDNLLVVVDAVGGDGANYRRLNSHGLALVAKLLMCCPQANHTMSSRRAPMISPGAVSLIAIGLTAISSRPIKI